MRVYVPVGWAELGSLAVAPIAAAARRAYVVDPQWRRGAPDVTEEEWEFEAQQLAADELDVLGGGVVLAVDLDPSPTSPPSDGGIEVEVALRRSDVRAVLTADLGWFGAQEIEALLAGRPA